jgi:tetratricopeptide (TPR) repeat protein
MSNLIQRYQNAFNDLREAWGGIMGVTDRLASGVGRENMAAMLSNNDELTSSLVAGATLLQAMQKKLETTLRNYESEMESVKLQLEESRSRTQSLQDHYDMISRRYTQAKEVYDQLFGVKESAVCDHQSEAIEKGIELSVTHGAAGGQTCEAEPIKFDSGKVEHILGLTADRTPKKREETEEFSEADFIREADQYMSHGDCERAEAEYLRCLRAYPKSIEAHLRLGSLFRSQRRFELSTIHFRKALDVDENQARVLVNLAINYCIRSEWESARFALEKALELEPENNSAKNLLSGVLTKLSNSKTMTEEAGEFRKAS